MKRIYVFIGIIAILVFVLGFSTAMTYRGVFIDFEELSIQTFNYDEIRRVGCHSNSMNGVLNCNDKLYLSKVTIDEELVEGGLYVFKNTYRNSTVVHRLVYCPNEECNPAIFKGDGNMVADAPVYRENILYKVSGVEYAR